MSASSSFRVSTATFLSSASTAVRSRTAILLPGSLSALRSGVSLLASLPHRAAAVVSARKERHRLIKERDEFYIAYTELRKADALKDAVYRISLAANDADDMNKLFYDIDMIVGSLLSADVFTIAFSDGSQKRISYEYYRNTTNLHRRPSAIENRLVEQVLGSGASVLAQPETVNSGNTDVSLGELLTRDWLGVPLRAKESTFGVVAIQNGGRTRYGEEEKHVLEFVSTQIAMSINRKRAENDLRVSEEKFSRIFASNPDPVLVVTLEHGSISDVNESFLQITGYAREDVIDHTMLELGLICNEDDRLKLTKIVRDTGAIRNVECWYRKKSGMLGVALISAELMFINGIACILSVAKEITDRKQSEDLIRTSLREKELLLKEIHHRVKNNLQVVSSLLHLQSRSITDVHMLEFLKESQTRVKSMAMIHEKLYTSGDLSHVDFGDYLRNLALSLMRTYGRGDVALELRVEDIHLSIDVAIPCGLIVNELISNSLKYAFVHLAEDAEFRKSITVKIELTPVGDTLLLIGDNGIGLPNHVTVETSNSLGMRLVGILTKQINGTLIIDRSAGTCFTILFPNR